MKSHIVITIITALFVCVIIGCSTNKPDTSSQALEQKTVSEAPQSAASTNGNASVINKIIFVGRVSFDSDVRPSKVETVDGKDGKKEYYAYEDGFIGIKIDAVQFTGTAKPLWIDKYDNLAVELPLEKPIAIPQKAVITINREGYKTIEVNVDITGDTVLIPEVQISKKNT